MQYTNLKIEAMLRFYLSLKLVHYNEDIWRPHYDNHKPIKHLILIKQLKTKDVKNPKPLKSRLIFIF